LANPYLCPNCKTNKTRFNLITQVPQSVKLDPQTGEIVQEYDSNQLDPFHLPYKGPNRKVQCAVCGLIDEEQSFIKRAEYMNNNKF
jgi:rubredoxin